MSYTAQASLMEPKLKEAWDKMGPRTKQTIIDKADRTDGLSSDGRITDAQKLATLSSYVQEFLDDSI